MRPIARGLKIIQPRVAAQRLPWDNRPKRPNGVWHSPQDPRITPPLWSLMTGSHPYAENTAASSFLWAFANRSCAIVDRKDAAAFDGCARVLGHGSLKQRGVALSICQYDRPMIQ